VSDELIQLMASTKKICNHLHIPLQSGSDKILRLMKRPYKQEEIIKKIRKIRKIMPDVAITTDVIVGFPGENEEDFKETCELIKKIKFSRLHVFPYSVHKRTASAKLPDKIAETEIKRRAKELRKIGKKLQEDYRKKFVGQKLEIVVERVKRAKAVKRAKDKKNEELVVGKTEYYFTVDYKLNKKTSNNLIGKIIKVKIC